MPMDRYFHFFPFPPFGMHGGVLRLLTAVRATPDAEVHVLWWEAAAREWRDVTLADIGQPGPRIVPPRIKHLGAAKRWFFPSVLWESGQPATAALPSAARRLGIRATDTLVLHTTLIAGAIPELHASGARVLVDVHDLVWRAHRTEAMRASAVQSVARTVYALHVRRREHEYLAQADGLMVCGWADTVALSSIGAASWAPVGIPVGDPNETSQPSPSRGTLRIGLIGNFDHRPNADSAHALLKSRLGSSDRVQLVFAGYGSENIAAESPRAKALGVIGDVRDFYREIDALVAPYENGAGMKCKLAEAALSGKLVVTTPAGAAGYPPHLARYFVIARDLSQFTPEMLDRHFAVDGQERAARKAFETAVGAAAATAVTRSALMPGS